MSVAGRTGGVWWRTGWRPWRALPVAHLLQGCCSRHRGRGRPAPQRRDGAKGHQTQGAQQQQGQQQGQGR